MCQLRGISSLNKFKYINRGLCVIIGNDLLDIPKSRHVRVLLCIHTSSYDLITDLITDRERTTNELVMGARVISWLKAWEEEVKKVTSDILFRDLAEIWHR